MRSPRFSLSLWRRRLAGGALLAAASCAQAVPPTTLGSVVGNAALCLDQVENRYFFSYLQEFYGPPYQREGGAYWFKATAGTVVWGVPITDVIVSDDSAPLVFVGLVADTAPDKLDNAIAAAAGVRHARVDNSAYPVRAATLGSKIVYFNTKSKLYCVKDRILPQQQR